MRTWAAGAPDAGRFLACANGVLGADRTAQRKDCLAPPPR